MEETPDEHLNVTLLESNSGSAGRLGRAISNNCPRLCPSTGIPPEPVCGSDDLIYPNICEMKKKTCSKLGANSVKVGLPASQPVIHQSHNLPLLSSCIPRTGKHAGMRAS